MTLPASVDAQLDTFDEVVHSAQQFYCPLEHYSVKLNNKFYVSAKMAKLCKQKSAEFKANQYSP